MRKRRFWGAGLKLGLAAMAIGAIAATLACGGDDNASAATKTIATTAASVPASSASPSPTTPAKVTKIKFQTNWFAQPENSGELAALVLGYYPKSLDVSVIDGGPGIGVEKQLATGQIDMGLCSADGMLIAKEQGINLVAFEAAFQDNPQVLIAQKEAGIKGFEDMKGKQVAVSDGVAFYDYLKNKYGWSESDKVKYQFNSPILTNKKMVQQGYYTSEPYFLEKEGASVDVFLIAKAGYNPYTSMVCATEDFYTKNKDAIKDFIAASAKGWQAVTKAGDDQAKVFAEIKKRGKDNSDESMAYAASKMPDIMFNDDTKANGFGHMTDERWKTLMDQMVALKVLKGPVDYKSVFTNEFIVK